MPASLADATAAPAPAQDADAQSNIPDPLDDVAAGKMPAVSLPPILKRDVSPQAQFVVQNLKDLGKFNLAYHEYKDQGISVVYNPKLISEAALNEAYAKKDLFGVAPLVGAPAPVDSAAPAAAPAAAEAPAASPAPESAPAAPAAGLSAMRVPTNKRLQSARLQNAKNPGINQPNPTVDQLAKRAI